MPGRSRAGARLSIATRQSAHHGLLSKHSPVSIHYLTCTMLMFLQTSAAAPAAAPAPVDPVRLGDLIKGNKTILAELAGKRPRISCTWHDQLACMYEHSCSCCSLHGTHQYHRPCIHPCCAAHNTQRPLSPMHFSIPPAALRTAATDPLQILCSTRSFARSSTRSFALATCTPYPMPHHPCIHHNTLTRHPPPPAPPPPPPPHPHHPPPPPTVLSLLTSFLQAWTSPARRWCPT